jgi:hypothetical protein
MTDLEKTLEEMKKAPKIQHPGDYKIDKLREVCLEVVNKTLHNLNVYAGFFVENFSEEVDGITLLKEKLVRYFNNNPNGGLEGVYVQGEKDADKTVSYIIEFEAGKPSNQLFGAKFTLNNKLEPKIFLSKDSAVYGGREFKFHPDDTLHSKCDIWGLAESNRISPEEFSKKIIQEELQGKKGSAIRTLEYLGRAEALMRQEILELRYNVDSLIKKYEGNKK